MPLHHSQFYISDDRLETVLEESRMSYRLLHESGEQMNIDYAGYCGQIALERLRNALNRPHLSAEDLAGMMRRAAKRHHQRDPDLRWSLFMADYITRHSNGNTQDLR